MNIKCPKCKCEKVFYTKCTNGGHFQGIRIKLGKYICMKCGHRFDYC